MRSKLFVPGARPELFAKAWAGEADAVSFDLEDSVPAEGKAEARVQVAAFLRAQQSRDLRRTVIVRTNALDTPHFEPDVLAIAGSGIDLINLPKIERVEDVLAAVHVLERVEAVHALTRPIRLLVNIETPQALRFAAGLARAHPRVAGLQLGLGDLFEPLGIDRYDTANVHATMLAVRMAAGEAGVFACDGAFTKVRDLAAFRAEAAMARRLGYIGKSCIHPSQVPLANEVFRASAEELAEAQRVVAAARKAEAQGRAAFVLDGRMIDTPFVRRAEAIIAGASGVGLGEQDTHS